MSRNMIFQHVYTSSDVLSLSMMSFPNTQTQTLAEEYLHSIDMHHYLLSPIVTPPLVSGARRTWNEYT